MPFLFSFKFAKICSSVSVSTAESASSNIKIGAFFLIARAMELLCFCPPDSVTPLSPTMVSYPSGNAMILSWIHAVFVAFTISSISALSVPNAILDLSVSENRKLSCGTYAIFSRSVFSGIVLISFPSIKIILGFVLYKCSSKLTSVDFPFPVRPIIASVVPAGTLR